MKVEVEVISNEIIKPSSPTPEHLRQYQLSYLDQLTPRTYNPLVLFYELKNDHKEISEISEQIKKSLSEVLNLYYPLAGRVNNNRFVDCNDEGVAYSEVRVNSALQLTEVVKNANPSQLSKLLPLELHELTEFLVSVRLNIFSGGGIALGICISHQLADALSCISFIKNWAAMSRGDHVETPQLISAKLFPWSDDLDFDPNVGITTTLSYLDQTSPETYNPLVLFYELKNDNKSKITEISEKIKKSLSEVLTLYYPLAGRVKNNRFIECNDEGISYSEARVNSDLRLSDVVKNANPSDLAKFLPLEIHKLTEFPVNVRLNIFSDGGIAIGVCVSHKLGDGLSCISFIKNWATLSRGTHVEMPYLSSAELFPWKDDIDVDTSAGITNMAVSRRFVFEASTIEAIRSKYVDKKVPLGQHRRPTRTEALSAFIWSRFVSLNRDEFIEGSKEAYILYHPVNIRRKLDPPLPDDSFGNIYRTAVTVLPASMNLESLESDEDLYGCELVRAIRKGIEKVDKDYVKKVQLGDDENMKIIKEDMINLMKRGGKMRGLAFTSLCRFPLYDNDFGFGDPLWVSSVTLSYNNVVAFMDTKEGNAIEAYICLEAQDMAKLEADEEFLKYVIAY